MKCCLVWPLAALCASVAVAQGVPVFLPASPSTVAWGYYWSKAKPALTVHSGDTVRIQTLSTCGPTERLRKRAWQRRTFPPTTQTIYDQVKDSGPGGHILTGPVADRRSRARRCARSADPQDRHRRAIRLQRLRRGPRLPAQRLSLQPQQDHSARSRKDDRALRARHRDPAASVLRQHGRRAAGSAGRIDSAPPWMHAGNMDNKELVAGTTLYIPVARQGRALRGWRRACRPGQRRGRHHRDGDLPDRHLPLRRAQGSASALAARRNAHQLHQHGLQPRSERRRPTLAVRDMIDFLVTEKHLTPRRRLHAHQRRGRCRHHAARRWQCRRTCHLPERNLC